MSDFVGPCIHGRDPFDRCDFCEYLTPEDAERLARAAELEAQAAAMREALEAIPACNHDPDDPHTSHCESIRAATAPDAGKALLERLRRAEELADGDLVHARLLQLRERLREAEAEAAEWKRNASVVEKAANAWADDARKMEVERDEARAELAALHVKHPPTR